MAQFTGKERDAESGLDYFGARYYGSALGRLTGPDQPFADQNTNDPQSWNLYSYVRNNPLNRIDADGHLTVIIPGTGWSPSNWNENMKLFNEAREKFHDPDVRILHWSGSLQDSALGNGASALTAMVSGHTFAPGEQLNVIGHSRGGDVAIEATETLTHKIDNLITLDTPAYYEHPLNPSNIGLWINVSVGQDWVLPMASNDPGRARNEPGASNIILNAPQYGPIAAHSAVWQDNSLRNPWWRFWQGHASCHEWWDNKTNTLHGCQ